MEPSTEDNDHDDAIQRQNWIALAFVSVLTLFSIWLVNSFIKHIQLEKCMEARRHNCETLDIEQNGQ